MFRSIRIAAFAALLLVRPAAAQLGSWQGPFVWPLVASHAALLSDGRVLVWSDFLGVTPRLWDPTTGNLTTLSQITTAVARSAQAILPSGEIGIVGGVDSGGLPLPNANRFAVAGTWLQMPFLANPRRHATCVLLGDGRILALSGEASPGQPVTIPEIATPGSAWTQLALAQLALPPSPWAFATSEGQVLVVGPASSSRMLDVDNFGSWNPVANMLVNGREAGSAVLLPGAPDRVLAIGGREPAVASCEILDYLQNGFWEEAAPMVHARRHHQATLLPDASVLVAGGTATGDDLTQAVYAAERYAPSTDTWTTLASMTVPRRKGSVALLLPDGRVLCAGGGDGTPGSETHFDIEIYSPPYLSASARPTITVAPASLVYAGGFTVDSPEAGNIAAVRLVRAGAVTQSFNSEQRIVDLAFSKTPGRLTVTAPANGNAAPPGTYMLFLVDDAGVPSVAKVVNVGVGVPQSVPPGITSSPPTTAQVNAPYTYVPSASGTAPITWSLVSAPGWLSVSPGTGSVAGVPTLTGPFGVTLKATNAIGNDTQSWTIQVGGGIGVRTIVPLGAIWRYWKGLTDPGSTWANLGYNDTAWLTGPSGFGFGDDDDATVLSDMRNNYSTVFTRRAFDLYNKHTVTKVSILYEYDDGLAVYLNGTRILSQRAPTTITHTSFATSSHEAGANLIRQDFTGSSTLNLLVNGTNLLAAVGLNSSLSSNDLTLKVVLEVTGGTDTPVDAGVVDAVTGGAHPNPFAGRTRVAFTITRPGDAWIEIYDARGRRVRRLEAGLLHAGAHDFAWDGRDAEARAVAPGLYFYKLVAPGLDRRGKLTLAP